jgi:hypothetical protein
VDDRVLGIFGNRYISGTLNEAHLPPWCDSAVGPGTHTAGPFLWARSMTSTEIAFRWTCCDVRANVKALKHLLKPAPRNRLAMRACYVVELDRALSKPTLAEIWLDSI